MGKTRNDLPDNTRKAMVDLLNARVMDAIDLRLSMKQAHWTVKGPTFIALHEMFDAMQGRADAFVDEIAERSIMLSGQVAGTAKAVAAGSKLEPYPTDITNEKEHIKALADRVAAFGKLAREAIDQADEAGDKDTADLFTSISRQMDMDLWFLEAHIA